LKVKIDADACIGCGLCVSTCPEVYRMDDDKAVVSVATVPAPAEENCKKSVDECPTTAIVIA